ncbi:MAG: sigma-70 family RNA polymerase sigma factor, partial [Candidatus Dormibacteraeota bacterium]|nr:sigma-70 family RNA polymerase sigma factor [Candidatus Dormibacteraeota bacterium]
MSEESLAQAFESERRSLVGVAYRMLGSVSEAEDAVQEAWLRLMRTPSSDIQNLGSWLRTVVARICLDVLRQRRTRREETAGERLPDLWVVDTRADPEEEVLLGEAVGAALQCLLEELPPLERVAFVLHDVFAMPFEEIAPIVERTPAAARQLASRGRRRVREAPHEVETDPI